MSDHKILLSQSGLLELQEELQLLKTEKRQEIADKLKEAISFGDLSENAEYAAAREEQAHIEGRISELEEMLKPGNYEIIDEKKSRKAGINIGATVTVQENKANEEPRTYKIVGSQEASILENKISNESPLGMAILGRNVGDTISVVPPSGEITEYTIVSVA